jgi:2-desacetyl-2-hydroxyethyl bacteriochlorophyllide A dehydrogenase
MNNYPMAIIEEPGKIKFRDMQVRDPKPDEVMIKVRYAAICGSDIHLYKGRHPSVNLPSAVGHEFSGTVVRLGQKVTRFKEGDRVTVEPIIACGECYYSRSGYYHLCTNVSFFYRRWQGAFAEYFYAPEQRVFCIPKSVSLEQGALIEPCAVALHAVRKSGITYGLTSTVIGGGAIGLLVLQHLLHTTGLKPLVIEINDFRLRKAISLGAVDTSAWSEDNFQQSILELTDGLGFEIAFEAVGMETTLSQALSMVRKGGKVVLLGIFEDPTPKVPVNLFVQKEISLVGSQGYTCDFEDSIHLVEEEKIRLNELITKRLPFECLQNGFDLMTQSNHNEIKVLIEVSD